VDCTTENYYGIVALMEPPKSWVARWQRCEKFEKGIYAIKVMGYLPEHVLNVLEENNITYTPRDGSQLD
jgi:transcription elongation factor SPT4